MPPLLEFLRAESQISLRRFFLLSMVSGLSNALVLTILNNASASGKSDGRFYLLILAQLMIVTYAVSQRYLTVSSVSEVERVLHKIRVRVADKIRKAELRELETVGRARIYATVSKETMTISQASLALVLGCQAAILLVFASIYIAILSLPALVVSILGVSVAGVIYFRNMAPLRQTMDESVSCDNDFFEKLTHVLDGFKETKLHLPRNAELFEHLREISDAATVLKIQTQSRFSELLIFTQIASYVLIAATVFLLPQLGNTQETVVKTTASLLFIFGPISTLFAAIQPFVRANAAAHRISAVEAGLAPSAARALPQTAVETKWGREFAKISMHDVLFHFPPRDTEPGFSVGPINFELRRGEVVFVVGGNGTGKSTFLMLLTALYRPQSGVIRVDGETMTGREELQRTLFSSVFADYHLFRRLYGLGNVPASEVDALLRRMQLDHKTRLVDRDFETLDMSTGQRKRLGLIVSLLEDRPIYVFDELAADQDAVFRRYFYMEILAEMKARGKTVITVTHDDRYWHVADRVYEMKEGQLRERFRPNEEVAP